MTAPKQPSLSQEPAATAPPTFGPIPVPVALVEDGSTLPAGWIVSYAVGAGAATTTPPLVPIIDQSTVTITYRRPPTSSSPGPTTTTTHCNRDDHDSIGTDDYEWWRGPRGPDNGLRRDGRAHPAHRPGIHTPLAALAMCLVGIAALTLARRPSQIANSRNRRDVEIVATQVAAIRYVPRRALPR